MHNRHKSSLLLVLIAFLLSSCATTKMTKVWHDRSYQAEPFQKILVIGVSQTMVARKMVEDQFVKQLGRADVEALPSYSVLPDYAKLKKETVLAKVKELGVDAVLVARVLDKRREETQHPGSRFGEPGEIYHDWYAYSMGTYTRPGRAGYATETEITAVETNLYEAKTEKLVWSGISETFQKRSLENSVKSYTKAVMKSLVDSHLLP